MDLPRICFVNVQPGEPRVVLCGAYALAVFSTDDADALEDLGWSFGQEAMDDVPVCARHYGWGSQELADAPCNA